MGNEVCVPLEKFSSTEVIDRYEASSYASCNAVEDFKTVDQAIIRYY